MQFRVRPEVVSDIFGRGPGITLLNNSISSYKGMMGSPSPHQRCHHFGNLFRDLL